MKVLLVCSGNIGHSQMAMEFYRKLSKDSTHSARTNVSVANEKIGERLGAQNVIKVMREQGIDIRNNTRSLLIPEVIENFDKVIVMAEPERIPPWLSSIPKFEYWKIPNLNGMSDEQTRKVRDMIKSKVEQLSRVKNEFN
jgi:protein-tyrosine-phosphatase